MNVEIWKCGNEETGMINQKSSSHQSYIITSYIIIAHRKN